ncbi:MAG: ATP synthase F1 subunit delta [Candidatus Sumerlaeia bacterium]
MNAHRQYSVVAQSYARALFGVARREGQLDRLAAESSALARGFEAVPAAMIFLDNPQVSTETKLAYLSGALGGRITPLIERMLGMLVHRDRVRFLGEILDNFGDLVEAAKGIGHATVETARELGADEKSRMSAVFERYTQHKLRIDWHVDPRLIGGVIFRHGDLMVDGSVKSGLEEIRERLLETTVLQT